MAIRYTSIEELMADERFLSWFFKTDEEQGKSWELFLETYPENKALAAEAVQWMERISLPEKSVSAQQEDKAWSAIKSKMIPQGVSVQQAPVIEMKRGRSRWWIPAAAILFLLAGLYFLRSGSAEKAPALQTRYGQVQEHRLPDGSGVTLNANSSLTLAEDWNGTDREVWLKGEAFFSVAKTGNKSRFTVHAGRFDIVVTGTQFNVAAREGRSQVLLTEGSVILKTGEGQEQVLKPGDFATINGGGTIQVGTVPQEKVLAWKEKKLYFEQTPMEEVALQIGEHYGVRVSLPSEATRNKKVSGIMPNDNLDVLLEALEATTNFRIRRENRDIVITEP